MCEVTSKDFILRYPEFDFLPHERIDIFLDDASEEISDTKFSERVCKKLVATLAAHELTLATISSFGESGAVGPITQKSVDKVSVSYSAIDAASLKGSGSWFNSTQYGQAYMQILRKYCPAIISTC